MAKALERAFGEGWFVQTQSPIILDDRSEPEPDVCVVRGSPRDYAAAHPTRPGLIVEVARSGLPLARGRKAAAYARAGIADYWILNLGDRALEVYREPGRPGPARRNWGYLVSPGRVAGPGPRPSNDLHRPHRCAAGRYDSYSVVRPGSINLAFESERMAIPKAKFSGLSSADPEACGLPRNVGINLNDKDISRAKGRY